MTKMLIILFLISFQQSFSQTAEIESVPFHESSEIHDKGIEFYKTKTQAHEYIDANNLKMPYRLFLPEGYDPKKSYPLILSFHGAGERGSDNLKQLVPWVAFWTHDNVQEKQPCIVLMPQCPIKEKWVNVPWVNGSYSITDVPVSKPMKMAKDIFDKIIIDYSIDKNRIYVVGASMGGYATWNFIMNYPNIIAAAIPVCGAGDPAIANKISNIPIWAFHGDIDETVPVSGSLEMINSLNLVKNNKARITLYENVGHESYMMFWKEKELIDWLFEQKKFN